MLTSRLLFDVARPDVLTQGYNKTCTVLGPAQPEELRSVDGCYQVRASASTGSAGYQQLTSPV